MTNDINRALADHDGKKPYRGYASAAIWTLKQGVRNFSGKDVAFYARKLGITEPGVIVVFPDGKQRWFRIAG